MTIRTVGELRAALADFPDYRALVVEVIVGGDLVTDVTALESLDERPIGTGGELGVALVPVETGYDVRALIDDGLRYREERTVLGDDDRRPPSPPRHCHADGAGPCLAVDCPIAGQRPRLCPGAPGPQHDARVM